MDRLTKRLPDNLGCVPVEGIGWPEIADRLAAYEDTGLEPEELKSLKETWDLFGGADGVQRVYVERDEYKQAESEGRLIVLPCKVGDTVWTMAQGIITNATVTRVKSPEITMRLDAFGYGHIRNTDDFGQTIFATREEAEAALGGDGDGC